MMLSSSTTTASSSAAASTLGAAASTNSNDNNNNNISNTSTTGQDHPNHNYKEVDDDPLSQAMSMLDSLNDNANAGSLGEDDFEDFEDFAIDSDGETNTVDDDDDDDDDTTYGVMVDDATTTVNGEYSSNVNEKMTRLAVVPAPSSSPAQHWATIQDVVELKLAASAENAIPTTTTTTTNTYTNTSLLNNGSNSNSTTFAHPLQEQVLPSSSGAILGAQPLACAVSGSAVRSGGNTATAIAEGGNSSSSSWTSNLASFVTSRVAGVAVTAATVSGGGGGGGGAGTGGSMAPAIPPATSTASSTISKLSSASPRTTSTMLSSGSGGGPSPRTNLQPQQQQQQQPPPPLSSKMTYTERQRLLHEQYYQATNNSNHASRPSSTTSTTSLSSSPSLTPSTHTPATARGGIIVGGNSQSATMTSSSSSTSGGDDAMAPNFVLSPTSPSKTLMTPSTTSSGSSEHAAIIPSSSSSSLLPTSNTAAATTFAEKLTSSLDAATKTKLIASALGGGGSSGSTDTDGQSLLLPGERVIMFLNMLKDVRDCTCEHTLMNSNIHTVGGNNTTNGNAPVNESNGDTINNNNPHYISSGGGGTVATTTVWCCVMTFYRVAVFSYLATLDGEVLFPEEDNDCEPAEEMTMMDKDAYTAAGDDNVDSSKAKYDDDDDNNNSMVQQWLRSQNVSIQFQEAHCPPPRRNGRRRQQQEQKRHHVFQMPLASIERVEKMLASSQIAMSGYGVGIHPSSSYSLSTPTSSSGGSVAVMQQLLPSSSSFSSSTVTASSSGAMMSSAMMSLGSQMMPLLGGMASGISGGVVGSSSGSGNVNLISNGGTKRSNALMGTESMEGYANSSGNSSSSSLPLGIKLHGKDGGRWIAFSTCSHSDAMRAHEALNTYAFPGRRNLGYLFAFESRRAEVMMLAAASSASQGGDGGQGNMEHRQDANDARAGNGGSTMTTTAAAAKPTRRRFVPLEEYKRQGIFQSRCSGGGDGESSSGGGGGGGTALAMSYGSPWAPILAANANYGLCATYPSVLVGPRSIVGSGSDDGMDGVASTNENNAGLLRRCAAFRAGNRLPSLTWGSSSHGGSIWRASQPKVGLQGNRSIEDERYLYAIGEEARRANLEADDVRRQSGDGGVAGSTTGTIERPPVEFLRMLCGRNNESDLIMETAGNSPCLLKIMDMRPKTSAMANRTQGYGYENTNHYRGMTINFYGIGNIHAVRDAYQKISALCLNPNTSDVNWMQLVENTNWPSMIRLILSASWQTAFHVHYNRLPVLVHCSHGWDRTSQVPALAQLLLDPHYRTREGFSTLVEKDFLSFGHPFHTRCGHGEGKNEQGRDEEQLAPIFMQFLDCVFQLVNQFPDYFEFNPRYLLLLSEHIYSCRFGTLLCDSEREREVVAGVRQRTYCLWDYLDSIPELVNPLFDKATYAGVLLMPLPMLLRNVTLWTDRHCMYGSKATMPCVPPTLRHAYPPSYMVSSPSEQQLVLHTMRAGAEGALARALNDVEMWKETALSALKELMELKKEKGENDDDGFVR